MTKRMPGGNDAGHHDWRFEKGTPEARQQMFQHADRLNAIGGGRHWYVASDGTLQVRSKLEQEQEMWRNDRIMPDDVTSVNYGLKRLGKPYRFTPDGFSYNLEFDDIDLAPDAFPLRDRLAVIQRREEQDKRAKFVNTGA